MQAERSSEKDGKLVGSSPGGSRSVDDRRPFLRKAGRLPPGSPPDKLRISPPGAAGRSSSSSGMMAYDQLLERLYLVDEGWIIKGATALLARDIVDPRHDRHRPLPRGGPEISEARPAPGRRPGHWRLGSASRLALRGRSSGTGGVRLP